MWAGNDPNFRLSAAREVPVLVLLRYLLIAIIAHTWSNEHSDVSPYFPDTFSLVVIGYVHR